MTGNGWLGTYCEQDIADGDIHQIKVIVPLEQTPDLDEDYTGAQLLVFARASQDRFDSDSDLIWNLIEQIAPY